MATQPDAFAHYLAAWNERDLERIGEHLARAVADNVLFVDPTHTTVGPAALEAIIRETRTSLPLADYALVTGIDGHDRRYRYRWEVRRPGEPPIPGMDVTTVNEAGRIERIDGLDRKSVV